MIYIYFFCLYVYIYPRGKDPEIQLQKSNPFLTSQRKHTQLQKSTPKQKQVESLYTIAKIHPKIKTS